MTDPAQSDAGLRALLLLAALWTLPWKGWALWKAARREDRWWFIALLVVNTLALLEIFYIFVIARDAPKPKVRDIGKARKERGSVSSASSS